MVSSQKNIKGLTKDYVYISDSTLTIEVNKIGQTELSPVEGFNGYFSYVIVLEVNREDVNEDMRLKVIVAN